MIAVIPNRKFFSCKDPHEINELMVLSPYALFVFAALVKYCYDVQYPAPTITSIGRTKEEDLALGAESNSHQTLRAFDISSAPYSKKIIDDIISYMTKHYGQWGAVNSKGEVRLAIYHKVTNGALHFHFSVHSRFSLPSFVGSV
jgi:hypothetical protein